jgi:hypothetical protein
VLAPTFWGSNRPVRSRWILRTREGVYLLYDDRDVIYVGRATDQGLGRRLFQHTVDRLASRWNRFSWFGLWRVTQNGNLEEMSPRPLLADTIVTTMEALLIEGSQNSRENAPVALVAP